MPETKKVRFLKSHEGYNAGEVAGFDPAAAERLIAAGTAEATELEATPEPTTEAEVLPEGGGRRRRGGGEE